MDEPTLIRHAANGDAAAWEPLVLAHQQAVFRLSYLLLGDPDEAEDIAQETFLRAWKYLKRFDSARPLRPWLLSIASNLASNRILALGVGLVGLAVAVTRKSRTALVLTGLALLVGLGSFVTGSTVPKVEAQSKPQQAEAVSEPAQAPGLSQVEIGQQLFVAKGCIACHRNRKIPNNSKYQTIDMGAPDLSNFSASAEILRIRLKDPSAAKSDTQMPNLELKEAEIEALIAFINSK